MVILLLGIPLGLIITGYCKYKDGGHPFGIVLTIVLGLFIHMIVLGFSIPFVFILAFAGAHTIPVGNALTLAGIFIYAIGLLLYRVIGWLLCSLVYGRLIRLNIDLSWKTKNSDSLK
jgi:hypothetical protein